MEDIMRLMIALGGNAIKQSHEAGSTEEQFRNCNLTAKQIATIIAKITPEGRVTITHGNGPQAGNLLVQQELGKSDVPVHPLDIVGAMTQGQIGYMLQQTITYNLQKLGVHTPVIAIINRVLVDKEDPQFFGDTASKPVGNFFTEIEALELKKQHPEYIMKKVKPNKNKAWRKVVSSPNPIRNLEAEGIRKMVDGGIVVIASGGGGIPVIQNENGQYEGVEAVIDKDLAGQLLAEVVGADVFLILTDVQKVKLNYGETNESEINTMTISQAKRHLKEGHFLAGSMGPKVEACIRFLTNGGKTAIITSLDCALEALNGETGTHIIAEN